MIGRDGYEVYMLPEYVLSAESNEDEIVAGALNCGSKGVLLSMNMMTGSLWKG